MEIPFKYVAFFVAVFIIMCYLLYNTAIYNAQLKERLKCKSNNNSSLLSVDDKEQDEDNIKVKDNIKDKSKEKQKSTEGIFKKGLKSYAAANGLEEVPKFL